MVRDKQTQANAQRASKRKSRKIDPIKQVNERIISEIAHRKRVIRNFPASPVEEALAFARQIFDFGSGEPVRRLSLFDHIGKAPESGTSRMLVTNAGKYGLTKGSYTSDLIELLPDGSRAVDPQIPEREQARARIKVAIEDIEVFAKLHQRFVGKALPAKAALRDAALEFGAPEAAADEAIDTFIVNLRFVGLLVTLSGAERVVSKEHALDLLPASGVQPQLHIGTNPRGAVITAEHAHYESTCFYIAPIGAADSEQRNIQICF